MIQKNPENTYKEFAHLLSSRFNKPLTGVDLYGFVVFTAYALFKATSISHDKFPTLNQVLKIIKGNELVRYSVENAFRDIWNTLSDIYLTLSDDLLKGVILTPNQLRTPWVYSTPESIISLSVELLEIIDSDKVADFGTGDGGFLVSAFKSNSNATYSGIEINTTLAAIASIRAEMLGKKVTVSQRNMFTIVEDNIKYDKVFSDYPFFGKDVREGKEYAMQLEQRGLSIPKRNYSYDWLFSKVIDDCISDKGKAVGIMTQGACFNSTDKTLRQYFIEEGLIEAVIALPQKMFIDTSVPRVLIIFSKGNKNIRFVDASDLYRKGRRQNEFSKEHIKAIIEATKRDSNISRTITPDELARDNYIISPKKLLAKPVKIKNAVKFGDLILNITRGTHINADDIDSISSETPTGYQYMMLRDIQDGVINDNLPYIKHIEPRLDRYCIASGDLLLSKNGAPFKVAIFDRPISTKVLATGNLFIIKLDETRIRPLYLKAFLDSDLGNALLDSISVGTAFPVIQVDALRNMMVPCPPLEEQQQLENNYLRNLNSIRSLKTQLSEAIEKSKSFFKEAE